MRLKIPHFRSHTVVLMYHRVACVSNDPWSLCVTPEHFAEHMEVLSREHCVRLDEAQSGGGRFGERSFAVTFDDGYADNFQNAAPILERYAIPATFFVTTAYIDSKSEFWWDELERIVYSTSDPGRLAREFGASPAEPAADQVHLDLYLKLQPLPHDARRRALERLRETAGVDSVPRESHRVMTGAELKQLSANDQLFEIGAHTMTHPLLAAQPPSEQFAEIRGSKDWLECRLRRSVTSFSYPYGGRGHYSWQSIQAVRDCGFERACTTEARNPSRAAFEWGRRQAPDVNGPAFREFLHA